MDCSNQRDTGYHRRRATERMDDPEYRAEYERMTREVAQVNEVMRALNDLREQGSMSKAELARVIGRNDAVVRLCLRNAECEAIIRPERLLAAEGQYSLERLHSVADEWSVHYPRLELICELLQKRRSSFALGDISEGDLDVLCLKLLDESPDSAADDARILRDYFQKQLNADGLRVALAHVLFRAGIVGLKTSSYTETQWSEGTMAQVPLLSTNNTTTIEVHKMFWRAFGINP